MVDNVKDIPIPSGGLWYNESGTDRYIEPNRYVDRYPKKQDEKWAFTELVRSGGKVIREHRPYSHIYCPKCGSFDLRFFYGDYELIGVCICEHEWEVYSG